MRTIQNLKQPVRTTAPNPTRRSICNAETAEHRGSGFTIQRAIIAGVILAVLLVLETPLQAGTDQSRQTLSTGIASTQNVSIRGASSQSRYVRDLTRSNWDAATSFQALAGRDPVDIEVRWTGTEERYSGVFFPVDGTVRTLIQGSSSQWQNFINLVAPLNGRFLDVEVGYFGSTKRYSAIFLEDGDNYSFALRTTNTEGQFQAWLDQYLREGRAIVDFEAYTEPDGDFRLAGVWVNDPNQPRTVLHYHIEAADISDLLRPLAGRLIDFERYWSPLHDEWRYAVITAMYPSGEWGHFRWMTSSELDDRHAQIADSNTHLTDIESWASGGTVYYGGVWGDGSKSLLEVDAIPTDLDPQTLSSDLSTLLTNFEASNQGTIGLWAKNLRTGQTLSWRAAEPFYLASSTKVAVHIRFWQEIQAGRLTLNQMLPYTNCANCRDDWFNGTAGRGFPGFNANNFGQSFSLQRFDRAMMEVSDNAATNGLVDDPGVGVSWDPVNLNEWLSGIPGVGRGWWPVTSIHDVDRTIMWQGQVVRFPDDTSFFTVPGWALEALFRDGGDTYGDVAAWLGNPASLPRWNSNEGHARYYAMGLNSATPRAFGRLLEGLWFGDYLDAETTRDAITSMTEFRPLGARLPSHIAVWAKGGVKGGASDPVSDTSLFEVGPDAISVGVFTKDNVRGAGTIRSSFTGPIGLEVAEALFADLQPDVSQSGFLPSEVFAGRDLGVAVRVVNTGGGHSASNFDVDFYASADTTISTSDFPIVTVRVPSIPSGESTVANNISAFPDTIPPGTYHIGFIVDSSNATIRGEVGEFSESNNIGIVPDARLEVILDPEPVFSDGFESTPG